MANVIQEGDGSPRIILSEPIGSTVEVLLYGAQVVSWKNEKREEMLFTTNKALWKPGKPVRGGISICFPQFSNLGSMEQPGFVRNRMWSLDSSPSPLPPANNQSTVDLMLKSTEEDLKSWPHRFELRMRISLSAGKLTVIPRVRNTDSKAFSFTFALCNYLSVSDIRFFSSLTRYSSCWCVKCVLRAWRHLTTLIICYKEKGTQQADAITFDGEIDRVYLYTPTKIAVIDHEKKRTFVLRKEGMPDAAVWNPWDKKAKAIPDFGDEDYKTMLCVDSASLETPIALKPCEEWKGRQELTAVSSSYCSGQLDPRKVLGFK
ncbi:UNVERIFIED_CONTAM: putative glucose-6-phosphate 1-epimerase [Sesamum calycinum]|uniref:glucose-6-phosphate 1-epimerase n=1 Tax=Sesamum calycinum TaxID=2727403 RepID=A0AAW2MLS7_9LAMI